MVFDVHFGASIILCRRFKLPQWPLNSRFGLRPPQQRFRDEEVAAEMRHAAPHGCRRWISPWAASSTEAALVISHCRCRISSIIFTIYISIEITLVIENSCKALTQVITFQIMLEALAVMHGYIFDGTLMIRQLFRCGDMCRALHHFSQRHASPSACFWFHAGGGYAHASSSSARTTHAAAAILFSVDRRILIFDIFQSSHYFGIAFMRYWGISRAVSRTQPITALISAEASIYIAIIAYNEPYGWRRLAFFFEEDIIYLGYSVACTT